MTSNQLNAALKQIRDSKNVVFCNEMADELLDWLKMTPGKCTAFRTFRGEKPPECIHVEEIAELKERGQKLFYKTLELENGRDFFQKQVKDQVKLKAQLQECRNLIHNALKYGHAAICGCVDPMACICWAKEARALKEKMGW